MYRPPLFAVDDRRKLIEAARAIQLATIVTPGPDGLQVTHVPVFLREDGDDLVLEFHVARGNPHWKLTGTGRSAAIFQGPDAYVHPGWYPTKHETGKAVPTWTYVTVHMHGALEVMETAEELRNHLDQLTNHNEHYRADAWKVEDAPTNYVSQMMRAIVGLRMKVELAEGSWKLNQHKGEADRDGVISGLTTEAPQVADLMAQAVMEGKRQ